MAYNLNIMESKIIIFSTKIVLPTIEKIMVDNSIIFLNNHKELENYKKEYSKSNGISLSAITVEYDEVPIELFNKASLIVDSIKRFDKEKNIAIYMLIKNNLIKVNKSNAK